MLMRCFWRWKEEEGGRQGEEEGEEEEVDFVMLPSPRPPLCHHFNLILSPPVHPYKHRGNLICRLPPWNDLQRSTLDIRPGSERRHCVAHSHLHPSVRALQRRKVILLFVDGLERVDRDAVETNDGLRVHLSSATTRTGGDGNARLTLLGSLRRTYLPSGCLRHRSAMVLTTPHPFARLMFICEAKSRGLYHCVPRIV